MTRPTRFTGSVPMLTNFLGYSEVDVEPEIPPPIDRAYSSNGGVVFTVNAPSSGGIVQTKIGSFQEGSGEYTLSFDTTPTNGNTMYALLFATDGLSVDTSGWSLSEEGTANGDSVSLWKKVAGASEPTAVHVPSVGITGTRRLVLYEVAGSFDVDGHTTDDAASSPLTGPSITPGSAPAVLIAGFIGQVATYAADPTWSPLNGLIADSFLRQNPGRLVSGAYHKTLEDTSAFTPSVTTTALYPGRLTASVAWTTSATPTDVQWNVEAAEVIDGDDVTYHEIDGPQVLRIDLGAAYTIVSMRLLAGSAVSGSVTYTIIGGNEADLSDGVALATLSYDSTGSFTADDNTLVWESDTAYQYYELDGSDENRRVYTWSLYEADITEGQDHSHDALQDQIDDVAQGIDDHVQDTDDAHDASAISVVDAGGYFTGDTVEEVLQEVGAVTSSVGAILGPLLLESTHSAPIVFDDILQASDGADFLYASSP